MEKSSSQPKQISLRDTLLIAGLSAATGFGVNYLLSKLSKDSKKADDQPKDRKFQRKNTVSLKEEAIQSRLKIEASMSKENALVSELRFLESETCDIERIPHLASLLGTTEFPRIVTPLLGDSKFRDVFGGEGSVFGPGMSMKDVKKYLRAGPRKFTYFQPEEVKACIVTCGGLCPGLNVVIREIYNCLHYNYKVKQIYGIKYGYKGFYSYPWEELNSDKLKGIHNLGGTVLASTRGGFDLEKIIKSLVDNGINQVYCVGGDGTHRGIGELYKGLAAKGLKVTVVGIPKTIDNDIAIIDRSFGFETAVEEAQRAISSANVEATCVENGIGLVKLMGRSAGFIALYASLASRDVNICLVPEFEFELYGPRGLLEYIIRRIKHKGHCVIVVAEGAGTAIKDYKLENKGFDASGNVKFSDVGLFLKQQITDYCKKQGVEVNLKYIDPTYMIRTVPANSLDKQICSQLAQNAVHGAMSGWTGFTIGNVANRTCMIPLREITHPPKPVNIQPNDRAWQRLLASTGQPSFLNEEQTKLDAKSS